MEPAHLETGTRSRKCAGRCFGLPVPGWGPIGGHAGAAESGADLAHSFVVAEPLAEFADRRSGFFGEGHPVVIEGLCERFAGRRRLVVPDVLVRHLYVVPARRPIVLRGCKR